MLEIGPELPHAGQGVADRLGQLGLAGDPRQLRLQPALQLVDDRLGTRLPEPDPIVRRMTTPVLLDGVEPGDALDGLLGDDRALRLEDVDELAPNVGQAGDLAHAARPIEFVEAGIAVGMDPALVAGQMPRRVLALAVDREPIVGGGRIRAVPGPLVADVRPDPRRLGLPVARGLQLDRRVVGEDRGAAQDVAPDRVGQGLQQRRRLADPARQGRSVEVDALTGEDPALPVERQVIAVLGDQHMGEQAGTWTPPLDRARW
jgi:hypothetical protein